MAEATIIIVNYNGAHLLPACLDALARQRSDAPEFDTIVVDNASVDGSRDLLACDYPWVRVLASDENLGFAGGNNLALREVATRFAVLLNNDAVPQPGWLAHLLEPFDAPGGERLGMTTGKIHFLPRYARLSLATAPFLPGGTDPRELGVMLTSVLVEGEQTLDRIGGSGCPWGTESDGGSRWRWTSAAGDVLIPLSPDLGDHAGRLIRDLKISLEVRAERDKPLTLDTGAQVVEVPVPATPTVVEIVVPAGTRLVDMLNNAGNVVFPDGSGADRGFRELDHGQYDEPVEVFAACGNGMAMRTDVARELGFFDDDYFMYYEDMDLSWRLRARGWSIRYLPEAGLRHVHAASSVEGSERFMYHVDRNRLLTITKNAPPGVALVQVLRFMTAFARVLVGRPGGPHAHRYPVLRHPDLARSVVASYLRLLPRMLHRRRVLRRVAVVPYGDFESWRVGPR